MGQWNFWRSPASLGQHLNTRGPVDFLEELDHSRGSILYRVTVTDEISKLVIFLLVQVKFPSAFLKYFVRNNGYVLVARLGNITIPFSQFSVLYLFS